MGSSRSGRSSSGRSSSGVSSRSHCGVGGDSSFTSGGSSVRSGSVGGRSSVRGGVGSGSGVSRSVSGLVFGGGLASCQGQGGGGSGDQGDDAHNVYPSEGFKRGHELLSKDEITGS